MAVEDRTGTCATCDGPIYRQPTGTPRIKPRWFHRRTEDWINSPHDPTPKEEVNA